MSETKFIHIADLHLGKQQFNNKERYKDYFRAFQWILDKSIDKKVDFLLFSGDLFDNRNIGPSVLTEVFTIINNFKKKAKEKLSHEIPIICIEGNHDNPIYSRKSWMTFLADLDLIILLSGSYDKKTNKFNFSEVSKNSNKGGKINLKDVEIYGLPFYGSSTQHLFPQLFEAIDGDPNKFTILMMHFGIKGYDSTKPGISLTKNLKKLHKKVDYLALGHFHKMYYIPRENPWIFNPGSLEINDLKEIFEGYERGAYLITYRGKEIIPEIINCEFGDTNSQMIPNRNFMSFSPIDISSTASFEETSDYIIQQLRMRGVPERNQDLDLNKSDLNCPVIIFSLKGEIPYSRVKVSIKRLRDEILNQFAVLDVRIFSPLLISSLDELPLPEEKRTIDGIETEVFRALVNENPKFIGIKDEVVELMKNLKSELLSNKPNYSELKDHIKFWSLQNSEHFKIPKIIMETKKEDLKIKEEETAEKEEEISPNKIEEEIDFDKYIDDFGDEN